MEAVKIADTEHYSVTSYCNGCSYDLVSKERGASIFFQGDDAAQFREELEACENLNPERSIDSILNSIWLDYDELCTPIREASHA